MYREGELESNLDEEEGQRCGVTVLPKPKDDSFYEICGKPAKEHLMGCVHEHVLGHLLCLPHYLAFQTGVESLLCMDCHDVDEHSCPLAFLPEDAQVPVDDVR